MATLMQNVDNISFVVDTLVIKGNKRLGTIRPDENGYYTVPVAVLGIATENQTYYDVDEFVAQMVSPQSFVNRLLTDGKLFGEYGHPMIKLMPEEKQIDRLMMIDEKCVSHQIGKLSTGETLANGGKVINGAIKPTGPYGESLKNSLDDPCLNTSFSLRSIAHSRQEGALTKRKIRHLVTFDFVNAGGYQEASKRYSPGVESLVNIDLIGPNLRVTEVACEHLTNSEINEVFGSRLITIGKTTTTFIDKQQALRAADGSMQSVYAALLKP